MSDLPFCLTAQCIYCTNTVSAVQIVDIGSVARKRLEFFTACFLTSRDIAFAFSIESVCGQIQYQTRCASSKKWRNQVVYHGGVHYPPSKIQFHSGCLVGQILQKQRILSLFPIQQTVPGPSFLAQYKPMFLLLGGGLGLYRRIGGYRAMMIAL